jgi:origin recognition complex subunit 3
MQLVVIVHDFEQFEPKVVQDLFNICRYADRTSLCFLLTAEPSLCIPQLPLIFVLALSSPPEPSYLHSTYPRATLTLLRIHKIAATSQVEAVEELLSKVCPILPISQPKLMDKDIFRPSV